VKAISGDTASFDLFAQLQHTRFPGGQTWRRPALDIGMLYHRVLDLL
jgi:gamma-glutamylputrescine oxidase